MATTLEFRSEWSLAIFDLQVAPKLPIKFRISLPYRSREEVQNNFLRWRLWRPSRIFHQNYHSYFYLQVIPKLLTKFRVNWHFGSGVQNRFSRWRPWKQSWISNRDDFSYFWSTNHPNTSCKVSSHLAFPFQEEMFKINFQDDSRGGHLGFLIGTTIAILSTSHPETPYQVSSQLAFRLRRRSLK